jgi:signal transduction histidine kinase
MPMAMTPPGTGPAAILIVEDEAVVALDLKMELEALGYQVAGIADTAGQALELARRHRPALVLMDIMLKGEEDGIAAAEQLRRDVGVPVVFLTSFSDVDTVRRAARTGAYGYLTKPFQPRELRAGIEVALCKAQLERSQAGEVLARVSHEMLTPLNAVLGFAGLLKNAPGSAARPDMDDFPEQILQAGRHLLALVEDLRDLQRSGDGSLRLQLRGVALDEAVQATLQWLAAPAQARDVRLEQRVPPGLRIHADGVRLRQVLLNLGSNAIKYNVHGGSVVFRAAPAGPGRVRLCIEDTGIGLSDQQLEHLFEPFNRLGREDLRVPGLGLGLVITRQLVQLMGGSITVARGAAGGTQVTLDLAGEPG